MIEVYASELYGDLSSATEASSVLTLQFRVLAPAYGTTPVREIFRRSYTRRTRLSQRTAQALVAAWNQDLASIMGGFLGDLKPELPPPGRPPA